MARQQRALGPRIVALLPHAEREQEARRHLALPALATRPNDQLAYAEFLPWDAARAFLDPYIRDPDPALRTIALPVLVRATRFTRDRAGEMLALLHTRRNEQDPVRLAALTALNELPPGIWRAEHLDALGQVVRDALDAADLSVTSIDALGTLLLALVPTHPIWAAGWLATLARERGTIASYGHGWYGSYRRPLYEQRLSDDDVRRIAPSLLPVLQAWETRELDGQLLVVARALGKRLPVFDGLLDLIERIITRTVNGWDADSALGLIAEHDPRRLERLVPSLLDADASWITRPHVQNWLHRYQQNLLDPYLGQRAYTGRFATGKTRYVLPLTDGFDRWLPDQQATFATTLTELLDDNEQNDLTRMSAINRLAALPDIAPETLIRYASLADPARTAVRDAALRALARLDAGQGIPTLLDALNDDRARIVIYALRRSILELPPEQALALLNTIPHPEPRIRINVLNRLASLPLTDRERRLLPSLLETLDSRLPDESAAAARAVFTTYAGRDANLVGAAITRILPNRRALLTTVTTLQSELRWKHEQLLPAAQATLDALDADPLATTLRLTLAVHTLPPTDLTSILETAATNGTLHPEALMRVVQTLESSRFSRRTSAAEIQDNDRLTASLDDRLRRIALALLLGSVRDPLGWTDERLARLHRFRADPSPLVATATQFTFPAE